jgi:tungstate transport system substrate-binding protein
MGSTLNTAVALDGITLSDRATWLGFRNKRDHKILVEGDNRLFNPYGVILVNPKRHPHVKKAEGQAFIDWLLSEEGQRAIASFSVNGSTLFHPNAVAGKK